MPFMIGSSPIRRTLNYLKEGKIVFRPHVKVFTINYSRFDKHHEGARKFAFWHLPQIIHNNPDVHCVAFKDMTPIPYIRIITDDEKSILIDLDSREKEDIVTHLENFRAICKSKKELEQITKDEKQSNPSYFGYQCIRHCICEVTGQVPCPSMIRLPSCWRGTSIVNDEFHIPPKFMEAGLEDLESMYS